MINVTGDYKTLSVKRKNLEAAGAAESDGTAETRLTMGEEKTVFAIFKCG